MPAPTRLGALGAHLRPSAALRPLPAAAGEERPPRAWAPREEGPLSTAQVAQWETEGYCLLPQAFTAEECALLRAEGERVCALEREEVWRESSGAPRTAFACHEYSDVFGKLARHPRLLRPVEQLLDGELYVHQSKVNAKAAFDGEVWQCTHASVSS